MFLFKDVGSDSDVSVDVLDIVLLDIGFQCGNGECEEGESKDICLVDCFGINFCGNGECDEGEEDMCFADCEIMKFECGNGECEEGEDETSCFVDCVSIGFVCGNDECEEGEDVMICFVDCDDVLLEECFECLGGLCDWCELVNIFCMVLDLFLCIEVVDVLVVVEIILSFVG